MFELTEHQRQELNRPEPVAVDPATQEEYVLIRREVYQRFKVLLEETLDIRDAYSLMAEVAANGGWDDPAMDIYNDFARKP